SDDVAGARRHLRESMLAWPKTEFLVQHWQNMLWEAEVELYTGNGAAAWERVHRDARALRQSHMFSVQLIAILTHFVRGRSAVASVSVLGDAAGARVALQRAIAAAEAVEMALHAAAARRQLGMLLGGGAGAATVGQADEAMKALGVRVPERYAQMLLPGRWSRA